LNPGDFLTCVRERYVCIAKDGRKRMDRIRSRVMLTNGIRHL
jgi:hypothetical protein